MLQPICMHHGRRPPGASATRTPEQKHPPSLWREQRAPLGRSALGSPNDGTQPVKEPRAEQEGQAERRPAEVTQQRTQVRRRCIQIPLLTDVAAPLLDETGVLHMQSMSFCVPGAGAPGAIGPSRETETEMGAGGVAAGAAAGAGVGMGGKVAAALQRRTGSSGGPRRPHAAPPWMARPRPGRRWRPRPRPCGRRSAASERPQACQSVCLEPADLGHRSRWRLHSPPPYQTVRQGWQDLIACVLPIFACCHPPCNAMQEVGRA